MTILMYLFVWIVSEKLLRYNYIWLLYFYRNFLLVFKLAVMIKLLLPIWVRNPSKYVYIVFFFLMVNFL